MGVPEKKRYDINVVFAKVFISLSQVINYKVYQYHKSAQSFLPEPKHFYLSHHTARGHKFIFTQVASFKTATINANYVDYNINKDTGYNIDLEMSQRFFTHFIACYFLNKTIYPIDIT